MILVPDTNACLAYSMDFEVTPEEGGPPVRVQRRGREAIVGMVNRAIKSGDLKILDVVAYEMHKTAKKAFDSAARRAGSPAGAGRKTVQAALDVFDPLYALFGVHNEDAHVDAVGNMYIDISNDPRMADAAARRRRVKKRHGDAADYPSPDTHRADFVILSTAAALAEQGGEVWLVTSDHDFVDFADAIYRVFGVSVVDYSNL